MTSQSTDNEPTLEELTANLRGTQLYMLHMDMVVDADDPISVLLPHLREHILWLRDQERNGTLFLSGANRDEEGWDGSGTAILRVASRAEAEALATTEPFHREGLRQNTVHGWTLNEGNLSLSVRLFDNTFEVL